MDFLRDWGPFAPVLLYLWIGIASAVAYVRTRRLYKNSPFFSQSVVALSCLLQFVFIVYDLERSPLLLFWAFYILYLLFPIILARRFPTADSNRNVMYHDHVDFMLFRRPQIIEDADISAPAHKSKQIAASYTAAVVSVTVLFAGLSYTGVGLQACGWLDTRLQRSGCLRSIVIDRSSIESVAFSPDGSLIAVGGSKQLSLYRVSDGQLERTLTGHTSWVSSVAFSPDGSLLASGSWDGTVRLWGVNSELQSFERILTTESNRGTTELTFSPDGTVLAEVSNIGDARLWRVADGALLRTVPSAGDAAAFSPDGRLLAVQEPLNHITLWQISEGRVLQTFPAHLSYISRLAFAPDGTTLFSAASGERSVKVWRVPDGTLLRTTPGSEHRHIAFSPDGTVVAAGGITQNGNNLDGLVEVLNVAEGAVARSWIGHRTMVNSVAFSSDGRMLASGSSWETVRLWRIAP